VKLEPQLQGCARPNSAEKGAILSDSFQYEEWKVLDKTLHVGDVYVMNPVLSFGACLILGFNSKGEASVARPYAIASNIGTTNANVLTGVERFTIPALHIAEHWVGKSVDGSYRT